MKMKSKSASERMIKNVAMLARHPDWLRLCDVIVSKVLESARVV